MIRSGELTGSQGSAEFFAISRSHRSVVGFTCILFYFLNLLVAISVVCCKEYMYNIMIVVTYIHLYSEKERRCF